MKPNKYYYIIAFLLLLSTKFMSYRDFRGPIATAMNLLLVLYMIFFLVVNLSFFFKSSKYYPSFPFVIAFSLLPVLTWFSCLVEHQQSLFNSFMAFVPHYFILSYFLMVKGKIRFENIVNLILAFAMIRTCLTLIEQITYPDVLFAFRMDMYDDYGRFNEVEVRSGFRRFLIGDAYFLVLFSGFYSFVKLSSEITVKFLAIFLLSILGIYMDGSRQVMVTFIISLLLYPIIGKNRGNIKYFLIILVLFIIIYTYSETFLGDIMSKTDEDLDTFNGRLSSYAYFGKNNGGILSKLFGHGIGNGSKTEWGRQLMSMHEIGLRPHDVGIVGALYMIGWPIVLSFVLYIVYVVRNNWRYVDVSVRLYILSMIFMFPFIFPLYNGTLPDYEMFLAILFYLVDISILSNKKKIKFN